VNEKGLDFYRRLIDRLLERGITPNVTLYHWDLPAALDDRGGWLAPEIVDAFADYADVAFRAFGDRVPMWATLNEPWVIVDGGYLYGGHAPGRASVAEASVAAKHLHRAGVPYIVQPNGTSGRIERRLAAKLIFDALFERDVLLNAGGIIAVTDWERRQLGGEHHAAGASTVTVVPNPLAPMPPCPLPARGAFRSRHGLTGAPLLMFLGMLSPRKHPDVLARAVAELARPDVQLVFAGNDMGAERRTRSVVSRLGLDARTRFTGLVTGPARFVALADADIVVYPSRDEAFGLVPLEALQAGTPVIVCNDGGCGEIIGAIGGGLLVPPGDARALAAAIAAMLDDLPRWRAGASRAGAEASRRFHPDRVAAQLETIYRDAVAGS